MEAGSLSGLKYAGQGICWYCRSSGEEHVPVFHNQWIPFAICLECYKRIANAAILSTSAASTFPQPEMPVVPVVPVKADSEEISEGTIILLSEGDVQEILAKTVFVPVDPLALPTPPVTNQDSTSGSSLHRYVPKAPTPASASVEKKPDVITIEIRKKQSDNPK